MKLQATPVSCWKRLFTRSNESPPPPTDEQNPQPSISSSSPTKGPSPIHRTVSSPVLPLPSKHKRHPSPSFSPSPDSYTPVVYSLDSTGSLPTDVISLSHPPPLSSPPLNSSQQRPPHFSNENEEIMNSEILSSFDKRFNVSISSYKKRHRRSSLDDYILLDSPERLEQYSLASLWPYLENPTFIWPIRVNQNHKTPRSNFQIIPLRIQMWFIIIMRDVLIVRIDYNKTTTKEKKNL